LNLHDFYEAMETWGEVVTEDTVNLLAEFNHYGNPSSISYGVVIPEACQLPAPTPPTPTPTPPVPAPTPPECTHLHATANKRWSSPDVTEYFPMSPTASEKVCSLATCGCRCRKTCEFWHTNYWSINRIANTSKGDKPGSWQCYCFPGLPARATEADSQHWYSGKTKFASVVDSHFTNLATGRCIQGADLGPHDKAGLHTCFDSDTQAWDFVAVDGDTYLLRNKHSRKCMVASKDSQDEYGQLSYSQVCHPDWVSQHWQLNDNGDGTFRLYNKARGSCLIDSGKFQPIMWNCKGGPEQHWTISSAPKIVLV